MSRWLTKMGKSNWTQEQDLWLVNNAQNFLSYQELASKFNEYFSTNRTRSSISNRLGQKHHLSLARVFNWTEDVDTWLSTHLCEYMTYDELTAALNDKYGAHLTRNAVKLRVNHVLKTGLGRTTLCQYTPEEKKYILSNYQSMSMTELAKGIKDFSGRIVSGSGIGHYLSDTLNIQKCGRHSTLKKNEIIGKICEVGEETLTESGYTFVKVSNTGIKNKDWKTKQAVVWKRLYGKEPDGIVIFLNRNKSDFSKENLYCLPRKVHAIMCANNWYTENRDNTLTAIKLCELICAVTQIEKDGQPLGYK